MPRTKDFEQIQSECGFTYPPSFLEAIPAFADLVSDPSFNAAFPDARLCLGPEIHAARRDGVPNRLIPFLLQSRRSHNDYYCFEAGNMKAESPVAAYAIHAVVHRWDSFPAFLKWVDEQIAQAAARRSGRERR